MVTKDFNILLEAVNNELAKAPEKIFRKNKEHYFIYNPIAYITYLLVKRSYETEELVPFINLPVLAMNGTILGYLNGNRLNIKEIITGLEIFKYELTNFYVYSTVNDSEDFIAEIEAFIKFDLAEYIEKLPEEERVEYIKSLYKEAELVEEEPVEVEAK